MFRVICTFLSITSRTVTRFSDNSKTIVVQNEKAIKIHAILRLR